MSLTNSPNWFSAPSGFYPYSIDQSLRFEDGDSPYLQRTSANGNTRTWTVSFWTKLCNHDTYQYFLNSSSTSDEIVFRMNNNGTLNFQIRGGLDAALSGSQVFRDLSAWMHFVIRVDTTQSTSTNRVRIYANNEQVSISGTFPDQNDVTTWNKNATNQIIGRRSNGTFYVNSYIAEFHNIDGQSLGPDSFGETKAGIWIPKEYTGSYGTAGFHLDFADSSAIGNDVSGNNNDLTASGLAATDVVLDSPTNNFCTYNALDRNAFNNSFISQGNLNVADYVSSAALTIGGTMSMRSGKWYFEILRKAAVNGGYWGIIREDKFAGQSSTGATGSSSGDYGYYVQFNGSLIKNGSTTSSFLTAFSTDDIIQVAYDADTGKVWFGRNNTWGGSGDPANGTNEAGTVDSYSDYGYKVWTSVIGNAFSYEQASLNCGQDSSFAGEITAGGNADANGIGDFKYAPPSGFLALCSANLPDPAIDPAQNEEPADYFNTVLYTGDGTTNRNITGYGFDPDFNWLKMRSSADNHVITDRLRGTNHLHTNTTSADSDLSYPALTTDGFTVSGGTYNNSGSTFVSWGWLAGGTAVSNTDGTITSSVSANTKAGFSIVTYTGNGSSSQTVGHGLGALSDPSLLIVKNRDQTDDWTVRININGTNSYLFLNSTAASGSSSVGLPTTDVFNVGTSGFDNASGEDYVAYLFSSVDGYSKVGSYTGNGSTDGTFIYTGFRPAWILFKSASIAASWILHDTARNTYNASNKHLRPNTNGSENTGANETIDILSNGFKHRGVSNYNANSSGQTYVYLAFAEQPFKYSNAR